MFVKTQGRGTQTSSPTPISRRRFLAMGSAAAATPLLGLWSAPAAGSTATINRLAIGYVAGSAELLNTDGPLLAGAEGIRVVRASAADGPLVRGAARVTAHGIYPAIATGSWGDKAVDLDVMTHKEEGEFARPVYLWSRKGLPVESIAPAAGLNLPPGSPLGLQVSVSEGGQSFVAQGQLGSGWTPLRQGIYLLAVGPASPLSGFALQSIMGGPRPSVVLSVDAGN
jgi:hypothetical protein